MEYNSVIKIMKCLIWNDMGRPEGHYDQDNVIDIRGI
jgi:hypothetical protein